MAASTPIRLGPSDHGRAMTLEEFLEAEETGGYRYELGRGRVEVAEVPDEPSGLVICRLYSALADQSRNHPGVIWRYGGAGDFRLWMPTMISARNPDVA